MGRLRHAACVLLLAAGLLPPAALGQLEGALAPGKLAEGHAKYEAECKNCHVPFDKAAQDRLCIDCHKEVRADVQGKVGMHGRIRIETCRECHTEHKGRAMNIAAFDPRKLDHAATDFALRGRHAEAKCESCHPPGKKYRLAPGACNDCHAKDDTHKGSLGPACHDCHDEAKWKPAKFDHSKTRFPLAGKHGPAKCESCHKPGTDYKAAPRDCNGCHRKDDKHRGRYGEKCEACHDAERWRHVVFDHDTATRYPLRFRHQAVKCDACHAGHLYRDKVSPACESCHRKDDKHKGTLGEKCGSCHGEQAWNRIRFDHGTTRFPLAGKHEPVPCKDCHADNATMKETPVACVACHRKADAQAHQGRYGAKCETCHLDTGWKLLRFEHDRDTRFRLGGAHRKVKCDSCHAARLYEDKAPTTCIGCHRKDDKHKGQVGTDCAKCHVEDDWKRAARFDHDRGSAFPLLGRHRLVECKSCHASLAYKDAKADCLSCHRKDDRHRGAYGAACEKCHNARSWAAWDFDHRRTAFPLDGAHGAPLACEACHKPGSRDPRIATACASCHARQDVHEGRFGRACERCHDTVKFNRIKPGSVPRRIP